jgi:hypothetical protein
MHMAAISAKGRVGTSYRGEFVTAFNTATMVLFASLGLVALALMLLVRRYSATALTIGLAGLLAITTVSTWITYATPENDVQVVDHLKEEIANLKAQIAAGNKELQSSHERTRELEKRVDARQAEIDQVRTDLAATRTQLDDARQDAAKARDETGQLKGSLEAEQAKRAELEMKLSELEKKRSELEKKLSEHVSSHSSAPMPPHSLVTTVGPGTVRRMLADRLDTPFYTSQPLEQHSLVAGLIGSWYVMRLKRGGKPFVFPDGQFRIPEAVLEVKESALQLQKDVLGPVAQVAKNKRLFLRGGADYRRLVSAPEAPAVHELLILPRLSDDSYGRVPGRVRSTVRVRNRDLPNLRADWLRQNIRRVLTPGSADIQILQNPPAADQERTVDLILYVEW